MADPSIISRFTAEQETNKSRGRWPLAEYPIVVSPLRECVVTARRGERSRRASPI